MADEVDVLLDFSTVEDAFLSVITKDVSNISSFADRFDALQQSYSHTTDDISSGIAHAAASNISAIAESFLEVNAKSLEIGAELQSDIADIFESLSLTESFNSTEHSKDNHNDSNGCYKPLTPATMKLAPPQSKGNKGSEIDRSSRWREAQVWLLKNIHNPFPSPTLKRQLAKSTMSTSKAIDDWFTTARRKIGWTAFIQRHFKRDRSVALDCAYRVLIKGAGQNSYCKEVVEGLEGIKATAERLYAEERNDNKLSSFAKELEELETWLLAVPTSRRRMSTVSSSSDSSSTSFSSSSTAISRKRSRGASEESDATAYSEDTNARELRPLKQSRSAESSFSSPSSSVPSLAASESGSSSSPELITPAPSPIQAKLPLELFDDWIEGLSTEVTFLPHDLSDKPQSVLSVKRASSDSALDAPSKRARFEQRQTSQPRTNETAEEPRPVSSQQPPAQLFAVPTMINETITNHPGAELDVTIVSQIISQLDFAIPQACSATLETDLFDFSIGHQAESSSDLLDLNALLASFSNSESVLPTTSEEVAVPSALQNATGDSNGNKAPLSSNPIAPINELDESLDAMAQNAALFPVLFSSLDFAFLEGLHTEIAPVPKAVLANAPIAPPCDVNSVNTLVDVPPSNSDCAKLNDLERVQKLERINALYTEANRLQQEVFG